MYYKDPDGNMIETQVDNFETNEETNAFMTSNEYLTNPIGVDFDPEDMIRRIESGESTQSLVKRPASGPRGIDTIPGF